MIIQTESNGEFLIWELFVVFSECSFFPLRGVRPFLSKKYDITKHPLYPLTSDYDKRNAFDIERFLSHRLKLRPEEAYQVKEVDLSGEAPSA